MQREISARQKERKSDRGTDIQQNRKDGQTCSKAERWEERKRKTQGQIKRHKYYFKRTRVQNKTTWVSMSIRDRYTRLI